MMPTYVYAIQSLIILTLFRCLNSLPIVSVNETATTSTPLPQYSVEFPYLFGPYKLNSQNFKLNDSFTTNHSRFQSKRGNLIGKIDSEFESDDQMTVGKCLINYLNGRSGETSDNEAKLRNQNPTWSLPNRKRCNIFVFPDDKPYDKRRNSIKYDEIINNNELSNESLKQLLNEFKNRELILNEESRSFSSNNPL
ncbi:hypothetical protein CHUAL_012147 [Chamberlinius hualienensis]